MNFSQNLIFRFDKGIRDINFILIRIREPLSDLSALGWLQRNPARFIRPGLAAP